MMKPLPTMNEVERSRFEWQTLAPLLHDINVDPCLRDEAPYGSGADDVARIWLDCDYGPTIARKRERCDPPAGRKIERQTRSATNNFTHCRPLVARSIACCGRRQWIVIETSANKVRLIWLRT